MITTSTSGMWMHRLVISRIKCTLVACLCINYKYQYITYIPGRDERHYKNHILSSSKSGWGCLRCFRSYCWCFSWQELAYDQISLLVTENYLIMRIAWNCWNRSAAPSFNRIIALSFPIRFNLLRWRKTFLAWLICGAFNLRKLSWQMRFWKGNWYKIARRTGNSK
jgi:hypothetical protein